MRTTVLRGYMSHEYEMNYDDVPCGSKEIPLNLIAIIIIITYSAVQYRNEGEDGLR